MNIQYTPPYRTTALRLTLPLLTLLGAWCIHQERLNANVTPWSPEPAPRLKLLFDYHHHLKPSTKVGEHLITGGWANNVGRYGWDDFAHTNSFDPLFTGLEEEFSIAILESRFSKDTLAATDAVVIVNPDSPKLTPEVPVLSDEEIDTLDDFVRAGGSLMIMINSGDHSTEKFEDVQLRKLTRRFGLDWNSDDTHYSDISLGDLHPYFHDVPIFHYGAGCTVNILDNAEAPVVLLEVASDPTYPERDVTGPGIVMTRPGKGKVILVGDTGSWGANISRPWSENRRVMRQLFRYLKPSRDVAAPQFEAGQTWTYDFTVGGLSGIPSKNSIGELNRPRHRWYRPREKTNIPYIEASGTLTLACRDVSETGAADLRADVTSFRWFEERMELDENEYLELAASRQGNVAGVEAVGEHAAWLAADTGALIALVPVDGIQIGDRWDSLEDIRIPTVQGSDTPVTKPVETETLYVRDEEVSGRPCRLFRIAFEVWLDDVDVMIEDLLPQNEIRRWDGPQYAFLHSRGGTLLVKREQWVDRETSLVLKARTQSRIVAWIHDLRQTVGASPDDKDQAMVASFAHIVNFIRR